MEKAIQKAKEKALFESESQMLGPDVAGALTKVAPVSTTMAFLTYFKKSGAKIKKFFTHDIPSLIQKPHTPMKTIFISLIVLSILGLCMFFYNYINKSESFINEGFTATSDRNNYLIQNIVNRLNAGSSTAYIPTSDVATKLMNIQPMIFKQPAFLGPVDKGYFDAKSGILNQLKVGSRFFFLHIDYLESSPNNNYDKINEPCLVYRDKYGNLTSKNSVSLVDVFSAINEFAYNDIVTSTVTPIVLYLHFVRMPFATTDTDNYVNYMSKVSSALDVLRPLLINGGYYRAAKEADLFSNDFPSFGKSVIIGTNIDTSVFTRMTVDQPKDLDYAINFHYYVLDNEKVDITTVAPHNQPYHALIFNASTILAMDPIVWAKYKNYYIIAKTSNDMNLSPEDMKKLLTTYGVNVVPYDYFDNDVSTSKKVKQLYTTPYSVKPLVLQV